MNTIKQIVPNTKTEIWKKKKKKHAKMWKTTSDTDHTTKVYHMIARETIGLISEQCEWHDTCKTPNFVK